MVLKSEYTHSMGSLSIRGLDQSTLCDFLNNYITRLYPSILISPSMLYWTDEDCHESNWNIDYSLLNGLNDEAMDDIGNIVEQLQLRFYVLNF